MNTSSIPGLGGGTSVLSASKAKFADNPFLRLLVQELRSQTPLEPVDNGAFMEQMASFSSMEQQRELNDNLLQLLDFQGTLARMQGLSQASALLGKEITFTLEGDRTGKGVVESVFVDDQGEVRVRVGDQEISLRQITGVASGKDGKKG